MLVSVQVLKGVKVDGSWTLRRVFEGLASGSEGCEGESRFKY